MTKETNAVRPPAERLDCLIHHFRHAEMKKQLQNTLISVLPYQT